MKTLLLILMLTAGFMTPGQAHAGSRAPAILSYKMSCAKAIAFYERYKRIYVLANRDIVPIYGMKSVSQAGRLNCGGRSSIHFYWVKTKDTNSCVIAAFCR